MAVGRLIGQISLGLATKEQQIPKQFERKSRASRKTVMYDYLLSLPTCKHLAPRVPRLAIPYDSQVDKYEYV